MAVAKKVKMYMEGEEEVLCIYSPAPTEWEIGFVWCTDRGGVSYFKFPLRQD